MSGDSPHNILNNQEAVGGGGGRPPIASNTTSTAALGMASIMPNSVGGSPGVEAALAAQISPNPNSNSMGQLPSNQGQLSSNNQGQMPQNLGVSTFQQGLQGQTAQLIGQKAGILRQQQQQQMMVSAALAASSSSSQQNLAVMGSNPMQSATGMHRSASVPRLSQSQQYNSRSPTYYGHTPMPFNHALQQQQQLGALGRTGMMGQGQGVGHLAILSGQPGQFNPHNIQPQVLAQARQKQAQMQNSQFQQSVSSGQALQGMQTIGMMSQLGLASQNRMNAYGQQRVTQSTLRSPSTQQSLSSPQKIQTQNLTRVPSLGSMNSQLTSLSQSGHSTIVPSSLAHNQQWSKIQQSNLSSSGSPSYQFQQQQRQQHSQLQQQPPPSPSQQQLTTGHPQQLSQQQHSSQLQQQQLQQSLQPHQMHRVSPLTGQRPSTPTGAQPVTPASSALPTSGTNNQGNEGGTLILGKRSIQDLVAQVDPNETADPELVDFLSELADDFLNSATEWGLAFAKHRNSPILDDKDMHLHLVKNYKLSVPGFTSKECNKKMRPSGSEAHLQRLAAIQRSMTPPQTESEAGVTKGSIGPFTGSSNSGVQVAKAMHNLAQTFPLSMGSPGVQKITRF